MLDMILGKMEEFVEVRTEQIDSTYDNIMEQANKGSKEAQTVLNYGDEKKIKIMINESMNR